MPPGNTSRNNIRIMRKSSPLLSALFNSTTQGVLGAIVLQPKREWYLSDLAAHLGVTPSSLQRTLSKLTDVGILLQRPSGNRVYYRADPECPILDELTGILIKTSGIADPLIDALRPFSARINCAFIHGSVAESRERSASDVDLIIIGDASNSDVALALRSVKDRLRREINVTRYTLKEFAEKLAAGNHFLTSVLQKPKIFLIGGADELDQIARRKTRGSRTNKQTRA